MGELLLCRESIAAMPFYVEGISINLYSLEELSYYIANNTYLLEPDFMSEELCTWIDKELKRTDLADRLRDMIRENAKLATFVELILKGTGYCTGQEIINICAAISDMEERSDFECNKIRADRLMERDKILAAIYEYKRLLGTEDAKQEAPEVVGNIWHNLGTAYARLFMFDAAIECYHMAYSLNQNPESRKGELMAYRCKRDESGFIRVAMEYGLDDNEMQQLRNELTMVSRSERMQEFETGLEEIARLPEQGEKEKYKQEIQAIIQNWKDGYRRLCRV